MNMSTHGLSVDLDDEILFGELYRDCDWEEYFLAERSWTAFERELLALGDIKRDTLRYSVDTPAGKWMVWCETADDEHERCYRSPEGQYYLSSTHGRIVEPWFDERPWKAHPMRVCPPCGLYELARREPQWNCLGDDPFQSAAAKADPRELLRWAAAAWFLSPEGSWRDEFDWPEDIADKIRLIKTWEDEKG